MMVLEDKYFRHYPDADKYNPKDVKNPEAIGEWLLAYNKIYELCTKYGCKAWGITDGGGKLHPILTPDEMRIQLYKQFDNGEDFYEIIAPTIDNFNFFDPSLTKYACNGPCLKIWVGTRNKNQVKLKKPFIVTKFEMPGYTIPEYSANIDKECGDEAIDSIMVPVATSPSDYHYWDNKEWNFDEFCAGIDKFDEFMQYNKKEYEPVLLELRKKILAGGDIEVLCKEVNDKYNLGWQIGSMF